MVNIGWDNELSEHLGIEQLGLVPSFKGLMHIHVNVATRLDDIYMSL